jgi:hypothetical protein
LDVKASRYALPMSVAQAWKVIELSKEDKEPKASKGDYSRVNAVNRDVCEVPICHKPRFVPSIMLDIVNEVHTNLLEALWNVYTLALVMEAVVVVELNHFEVGHGLVG